MSSNSSFHEDPAESCTKPADKQYIHDAEESYSIPARSRSVHADQVDMNATDHQPQVNRNSHDDEERPDVRNGESKVQAHEPRESNMQTKPRPGTSSSLPKKNGLVNGSGKRSKGQANKLAKPVNQPASDHSHLTSLQTPLTPLMSSLFPASFAPAAIFTPSNENGHGQMSYSNQSLHKIQRQDPSLANVPTRMVSATDSSQENQRTSSKVLAKSHNGAKRRKPAVESHDRAAAMETLTQSSPLLPQFYYPPGHVLFPQLDSCHVQNLQGYSNYSVFPQRLNDYSWMAHQNAAFHSSNITNTNSALEIANLANIKAFSVPAQQKPPSDSSYSKQKLEKSTNEDHKVHEEPIQENEEIKCTTAIKSEPCFPVTKSNIGSPVGTSSLHSPQLNSSNEFMFGQSRKSPPRRAFNYKRKNDVSDSDLRGIAPKKKRLSGGENVSVSWTTSPHSSAAQHKFNPPITSSPHSHKPASESPAPIFSVPSPLTPRSTQLAPSSSETALVPEQALEYQQFPIVPLQPNVSTVGQVVAREPDVFYCHMCSYFDKSKTEFEAHMSTHFEFSCPHCDYTARTEGRLIRHIKDFHSENSFKRHVSDRSKTYKCKQCTFTSTEREKFWEHSRTHIKEDKRLECPHCLFVTEHKHHLEYHLSNHSGSKPFKCPKCNYSCVNRSMLNSHMKSHTNIYPHRCSDCTYASKYAHSLKLHLKKYKHKPAMALNHDGSLPEKTDGENSGLHSGTKSHCSTDQSDLRNDAVNPNFSQFGMSTAALGMPNAALGMPSAPLRMPVMAPAFNNMMPFWPMLHPSAMQPRMLTGTMMFNQLVGIGGVNKDDSEIEGESKHATKNEKGKINSRMDINNLVCQKCSITFQSTEAWYHHIYFVHGNTAKEAAEYSYSNEEVPRNRHNNKSNCNQDWKNHELLHPLTAPDDQQDQVCQNNSSSHILPRVNSDHVNNERGQKAKSANSLPESSPLPLNPDKSSCKHKLEKIHQNVAISNNKNENISDPTNRADTLQQVTENCQPEISSQKKILPSEQTLQEVERNTQNTITDFKNNFHFQCSPSAVDISQQKPSTVFSNLDFPSEKDKENIKRYKEHSGNQVTSPSRASTLLPSKHILSEGENIVINNQISDEITMPRKRSRKGKAYKLDIGSLQKQKIPTDSSCDEAEPEFVTGIAFGQGTSLKFINNDKTVDETNLTEIQRCKPKVVSDQQAVTGKNNVGLYDAKSKYLGTRNLHKMVPENYKKRKTEFLQNKNTNKEEIEIKAKNTNSDVEAIENSENGQIILHEVEIEIQKFQNEQVESYSKKLETCQADTEWVNISENTNGKLCVDSQAKENVTEVSASNGTASDNVVMTAQSQKTIDHLNQTEMRNSANEEKEETFCSPVKRTNLGWSMMKLGMIPMSSKLPPVRSSSQKQTCMSSPVLQGSLPDLSVRGYEHLAIHNDIKSSDVLPDPSPSNYFNSPQPSNPHTPNSALLAKPPANLVSSPPKAYVHPTNRKTPDPTVAPPASINKQKERKLYECIHCELSFGDCIMYTVHMGYHSKQNAFQCNNCGVVCQDRIEFFLHMVQSSHV